MAKKIIDYSGKHLTPDELKILARVVRDPFFFSTFCYVINPVHGKVPFNLYPFQKSTLYQFLVERFNIVLKGRQMGVTELIAMYCLWLAMYHDNKKINIISIKDTVAKKVLKKIKFMYKNLPWYLQVPITNGRSGEYGNQTDMEFSNGSFITSIPTTEQAGRSESLSLLVIDETAAVRWASTIWASAAPTLSTGGSAILNSCITGDTEIIGRNGNFRVEQICPKEFGVQDVGFMGLEVLTHKLQWKKVLYGVNKGNLETWEIINQYEDIIKCTPAHKFLTPHGWKSAREIIKGGLYTIRYQSQTGVDALTKLTLVRKFSATIYDLTVEGDESYISASNYVSHNTPLGVGGFYHGTWADAVSGTNGFNPIRLHWDLHPERDQAWYDSMAAFLGPKRTAQEIDGDFLSSGNTVFEMTDIKAIEQMLSEYPSLKTRFNGQYREFNEVDMSREYFIGADCSTGRSTDSSAFSVMDRDGEETAAFKGKIPINKYGKLLGDIGRKWNYAKLAPETNDIGVAVTSYLQDEGYPNLYYFSKLIRKKGKKKPEQELYPGWLTTSKNRSVIIEGLEADIREDNIVIKNPFFVNEAYTFIYDGMGRPVAMGKHNRTSSVDIDLEGETYSDDAIFGTAIANHVRKTSQNNIVTTPK